MRQYTDLWLAMLAGAACAAMTAGPALAADLLLTKGEATALVENNVGKPFWLLEAQCAGAYGAAYGFEQAHGHAGLAESDKALGVAMLDNALARLETDRGLDRDAAMALAVPEVDAGRGEAAGMLAKSGSGPDSDWNVLRSGCEDIAAAARAHSDS